MCQMKAQHTHGLISSFDTAACNDGQAAHRCPPLPVAAHSTQYASAYASASVTASVNVSTRSRSSISPFLQAATYRSKLGNASAQNKPLRPNLGKKARYVLVVDDEASVRKVTVEILREADVQTLEAENGPAGVELFRQYANEITLVLLDFAMPGMDGEQVLKQMRKIDASVPIIFFSGYGRHEIARYFQDGDIVGFLQKPYSIKELLLTVQKNVNS